MMELTEWQKRVLRLLMAEGECTEEVARTFVLDRDDAELERYYFKKIALSENNQQA